MVQRLLVSMQACRRDEHARRFTFKRLLKLSMAMLMRIRSCAKSAGSVMCSMCHNPALSTTASGA